MHYVILCLTNQESLKHGLHVQLLFKSCEVWRRWSSRYTAGTKQLLSWDPVPLFSVDFRLPCFMSFLFMDIFPVSSNIWFYTYSNHTIHRAPWVLSLEQGGRHLILATLGPISMQSWLQCDHLYLRCWSPNTLLL